MPLATFSGIVMDRLHSSIAEMGLDADAIMREADYQSVLDKRNVDATFRISHNSSPALWDIIERETGNPHPGLLIGETFDLSRGLALTYLYLSSPTFGDALIAGLSYPRLLSDALEFHLSTPEEIEQQGYCRFGFNYNLEDTNYRRHLAEMTAAAFCVFFRNVTAGAFKPLTIGFAHAEPKCTDEHQRIFNCELKFEQDSNFIILSKDLLSLPCLLPEPNMAEAHRQIMDDQLLHLENHDLIHLVTDAIGRILSMGEVSLERVAQDLGLKPARLRYLLSELGTSFSELLSEYRSEMAKRLLSETDDSIDQIIFLTGFSEPSPFYRAFKRWTGMTPVSFREQQRSAGSGNPDPDNPKPDNPKDSKAG